VANYLCEAGGTLNSAYAWSFRSYATSPDSEGAVQAAWNSGIVAMFGVSAFQALVPTEVELTYTYTSTMNSNWKQTTKTQNDVSVVGSATTSLPYHVSEVVTWRTAQATKYGHGRWFLPPLGVTALATGGFSLSAAAQTDIVSAVNAAITAWGSTLSLVILHRNGTKSGPGPLTTDPVIGGDVPNILNTQRRRADKIVPSRVALTF
jgi:hypothetical protein